MNAATTANAGVWRSDLARVRHVRVETPDVSTYDLACDAWRRVRSPAFLPGQFCMLYAPGVGEAALSISSDPSDDGVFSLTVRRLGAVTGALARGGVGAAVGVRGPFGRPWPLDRCVGQDVVIAAGGIGLAPLRPAIRQIIARRRYYGRVVVVYGARTPDQLLYREEYDAWRAAGVEVLVTVDVDAPGWDGHIGVVPSLLESVDTQFDTATVLACGPEIMMRFVAREALRRGARPARVYLSMERNMSCGMGLCGRCQAGPILLCRDGPVLSYETVAPYLGLEDL